MYIGIRMVEAVRSCKFPLLFETGNRIAAMEIAVNVLPWPIPG